MRIARSSLSPSRSSPRRPSFRPPCSRKGARCARRRSTARSIRLTEAFNVSSLFLMATPYTVVGTIGAWIYIASRRRPASGRSRRRHTEVQ